MAGVTGDVRAFIFSENTRCGGVLRSNFIRRALEGSLCANFSGNLGHVQTRPRLAAAFNNPSIPEQPFLAFIKWGHSSPRFMNIIAEEIKHPGNPQTVWHGILSALLHDWDYSGLTYGSGAIC